MGRGNGLFIALMGIGNSIKITISLIPSFPHSPFPSTKQTKTKVLKFYYLWNRELNHYLKFEFIVNN
jgi:hypothetical protein